MSAACALTRALSIMGEEEGEKTTVGCGGSCRRCWPLRRPTEVSRAGLRRMAGMESACCCERLITDDCWSWW